MRNTPHGALRVFYVIFLSLGCDGPPVSNSRGEGVANKEEASADTIERFAVSRAATFPYGDVNISGTLSGIDAVSVARHLSGMQSLTEQGEKRADVDGDGFVTSLDSNLIARAVAGLAVLPVFPKEPQIKIGFNLAGHNIARRSMKFTIDYLPKGAECTSIERTYDKFGGDAKIVSSSGYTFFYASSATKLYMYYPSQFHSGEFFGVRVTCSLKDPSGSVTKTLRTKELRWELATNTESVVD